jgi:hypothetical protein
MTTYIFPEVEHRVQRRIDCAAGCGKKLTRTRTFSQTINPFNKNAAGEVKSRSEIYEELKVEAAKWQPSATCLKCTERIEGAKPVPPRKALVNTAKPGSWADGRYEVVTAESIAEAREKAAQELRDTIAEYQERLASIGEWSVRCYPRKGCKHGDDPCFPETAADAGAVA